MKTMYFEFVSMHSRIPCCYFTSMPNNLAYIPILIDLIPIHVPYLDILRHLGISRHFLGIFSAFLSIQQKLSKILLSKGMNQSNYRVLLCHLYKYEAQNSKQDCCLNVEDNSWAKSSTICRHQVYSSDHRKACMTAGYICSLIPI